MLTAAPKQTTPASRAFSGKVGPGSPARMRFAQMHQLKPKMQFIFE
jgi:hypothetical protein